MAKWERSVSVGEIERWGWPAGGVIARIALAAGFLSAVADRLGVWGAAGTGQVAWGNYSRYLDYVHTLAPYLPGVAVGVAGWAATLVELFLGIALLLGVLPRLSAFAGAATLMLFGLSMFFFFDYEAPLSASVFSAAAAALLLGLAPDRAFVLSAVPALRSVRRRRAAVPDTTGNGAEQGGPVGMIDADMRLIVEAAKLTFVATVAPDGSPNLSPKGSVRVYDDQHLAFMDIASPHTITNLIADPRIELNSVDFLRRRGYRFAGTGEVHGPGTAAYQWLYRWLLELNGPEYPAHQAVLVRVDQVCPITSPAYTFGGAEESDLIAEWTTKYHVTTDAGSGQE